MEATHGGFLRARLLSKRVQSCFTGGSYFLLILACILGAHISWISFPWPYYLPATAISLALMIPVTGVYLARNLFCEPPNLSTSRSSVDPLLDENVDFQTANGPTGTRLSAWWICPQGPGASKHVAVVCVHDAFSDHRECLPHARALAAEGHVALVFDCYGCGSSDGPRGVGYGIAECADVLSAVECARRRPGIKSVVVLGIGLGGTAAILAAAKTRGIHAVVAEAPMAGLQQVRHVDIMHHYRS